MHDDFHTAEKWIREGSEIVYRSNPIAWMAASRIITKTSTPGSHCQLPLYHCLEFPPVSYRTNCKIILHNICLYNDDVVLIFPMRRAFRGILHRPNTFWWMLVDMDWLGLPLTFRSWQFTSAYVSTRFITEFNTPRSGNICNSMIFTATGGVLMSICTRSNLLCKAHSSKTL
jgi:hypothetical protein